MKRAVLALAALVVAATAAVHAAEEAAPATLSPVDQAHAEYREKVMHTIGENIGAVGTILKNGLPLEGNVAAHAKQLELAAGLIESAFQKKVVSHESLPVIWEDWEGFVAAAAKMEAASANLAEVAATGDKAAIGQAMRALGGTCGDCHRTYRKQD